MNGGRKTEGQSEGTRLAFVSVLIILIYVLLAAEIGFWISVISHDFFLSYIATFGIIGLMFYLGIRYLLPEPVLNFEVRVFHTLEEKGLIETNAQFADDMTPLPTEIGHRRAEKRKSPSRA